jgi:hypothetical protein
MTHTRVRLDIGNINTTAIAGIVISRRPELESIIPNHHGAIEDLVDDLRNPLNIGQTNTSTFYVRDILHCLPFNGGIWNRVRKWIDRINAVCENGGAAACSAAQTCTDESNEHLLYTQHHHQIGRAVGSSAPLDH